MCSTVQMIGVYRFRYYSGFSDSGHSEIRTTSLQRTQLEAQYIFALYFEYILNLPNRTTSLQRTMESVLKCFLLGDSTTYICTNYSTC